MGPAAALTTRSSDGRKTGSRQVCFPHSEGQTRAAIALGSASSAPAFALRHLAKSHRGEQLSAQHGSSPATPGPPQPLTGMQPLRPWRPAGDPGTSSYLELREGNRGGRGRRRRGRKGGGRTPGTARAAVQPASGHH